MKIKKTLIPSLMVLIGFVALSFTPAKDSVMLRLKPKKGETYTVSNKTSLMNLMEIQGQSMSSTQVTETRSSVTVKDLNENDVILEGATEAMKLTVSQMGMVLTYDSEHPEKTSPMIADQVSELSSSLNQPFTKKYDVLGKSIEDDETHAALLGEIIIELPKEPIAVGTKWNTKKTQAISDTELVAEMIYTVSKISKRSIELDVAGTVESGDEVSGTYEGTISLNPETGMVIKSVIKENISMTISQQGLSIPITMNGTTTTTVE